MIYSQSFLAQIKETTDQLADGQFDELVSNGVIARSEVAMIANSLESYGKPFVPSPNRFWRQVFVTPIGYAGDAWDVIAPLYNLRNEQSDMQAQFRVTAVNEQLQFRLHTVYVP